jgi:multiple sugar transport system permease protein
VNNMLSAIGLPTSLWLFSETTVIPSVVLTGLWAVGGMFVIFLAGMENVPKQYYEAIEIDGGNALHKLVRITIPMLTPTIFFNTIMSIINASQAFTQAYILTQGGPNNASLFYVFYLWREAFRNARMGYACAIAWVLFIIILIFTGIIFKTSTPWVYYEGGQKNR